MPPTLSDIDFIKLLKCDPEVGVAIVSGDGRLITYSENMPAVFGADASRDYQGMQLDEVFLSEFADERNEFILQAIRSETPIHIEHLLQASRIVSTIMPLDRNAEPPYAAIFSRRGKLDDHAPVRKVHTQYVDLGHLAALSKRELEVLVLLGHGHSVPQAAKILHRSPRTIEQHKSSIGRKLGSSSLATLAKTVGQIGLTFDDLELQRITAVRPQFRV